MKKVITMFAAIILVASASAQFRNGDHGRGNDRDAVYNDDRYEKNDRRDNRYSFSARERDMQIAHINREYNQRIHAVRNKWLTGHGKKQRMIRALEDERRYEIRKVYAKFNHPANRYNNHDRRRH